MIVMLASRTAPDVIRVDHYDFPALVRKGYFHDLTEFVRGDPEVNPEDFWPQAWEECLYRGRVFGINVLYGGVVLYYNKSMVEQAGLQDPYVLAKRGGWTWEQLREHAVAMTRRTRDGRPLQFGFAIPGLVNQGPLIWGYGADFLSPDLKTCVLDSDEAIEAYRLLIGMRWRDNCAPTPSQAAQGAFTFESGKLGMSFDWMGMAPRYRQTIRSFEWDICPVPAGPRGRFTPVKGNQLVMYAETDRAEAAWEFMKHVTSPQTEMYLCGRLRRALAARKSVALSPEYLRTDLPPFQTEVFAEAVSYGRRLPIDHRWAEWSVVANRHLERLYVNGAERVGRVLPELAREVTAVLRSDEGF
jgi:multiple sugar transport system substrate-binding protein